MLYIIYTVYYKLYTVYYILYICRSPADLSISYRYNIS